MTDENKPYGDLDPINLDKEIENTIFDIIKACGVRPLKEVVSLLYLSIDYIFSHNKELAQSFYDDVTIH